ncbi:MAG: hypothetical protein ACTHKK_11800, partial [Candidatus Nitrosocosmicus sp.]
MVLSQNNLLFFKKVLEKLKQDNLYRTLRAFDVDKDHSLKYNNNPVINFSSNDYLGLSTNKKTISNINKITKFQTSPCSSRLISGTTSKVKDLETNLSLH